MGEIEMAGTAWPTRRQLAAEVRSVVRDLPISDRPVNSAYVDLYWLPLGAGGHSVRWNGRIFEALVARHEHRATKDLYHSALEVQVPEGRFVIEMGPAQRAQTDEHDVACSGAVGAEWLGRSRFFRYEVRRWRNGTIPDVGEAVASPQRLSDDPAQAREVLQLVPLFPTATWGRDEFQAGDMWNSNSLTAWLLARSGHGMGEIHPPEHGRAPGWIAGLTVAGRQQSPSLEPASSRMPDGS
jgi:hypothetical protein